MTDTPPEETRALAVIPRGTRRHLSDPEVQELAAELLAQAQGQSGLFPATMNRQQALAIAGLAIGYDLDPFQQEIILYQGIPYVTIKGHVRVANRHPAYRGLTCVPATEEERRAFMCDPNEHLWVTHVYRRDRDFPTVGYGRVKGASEVNTVAKAWAQEMAQKRSKHRALREAFSLPLPTGFEELSAVEQGAQLGLIIEHDADLVLPEGLEVAEPEPVTRKQSITVHVLLRELGWNDDEYRRFLAGTFGVASSNDLTEAGAAALIETLSALAQRVPDEPSRALLKADLAKNGWVMADLWGAEEPAVDAMATALAEPEVVEDAGDPPEAPTPEGDIWTPCTDEQWAAIEERVPPRQRASLDRDRLDEEHAALILARWQPKEV